MTDPRETIGRAMLSGDGQLAESVVEFQAQVARLTAEMAAMTEARNNAVAWWGDVKTKLAEAKTPPPITSEQEEEVRRFERELRSAGHVVACGQTPESYSVSLESFPLADALATVLAKLAAVELARITPPNAELLLRAEISELAAKNAGLVAGLAAARRDGEEMAFDVARVICRDLHEGRFPGCGKVLSLTDMQAAKTWIADTILAAGKNPSVARDVETE